MCSMRENRRHPDKQREQEVPLLTEMLKQVAVCIVEGVGAANAASEPVGL